MLVEGAFELLEVLPEHVLPAELSPAPEVVDLGARLHAVLLEHPVDLLLLAPHHLPIIAFDFLPLTADESLVNAVPEGCFELDILPR